MKKEDLFESLQGIDPEFLEESERTSATKRWRPLAAIAACLVLIVSAVLVLSAVRNDAPPKSEDMKLQATQTVPTDEYMASVSENHSASTEQDESVYYNQLAQKQTEESDSNIESLLRYPHIVSSTEGNYRILDIRGRDQTLSDEQLRSLLPESFPALSDLSGTAHFEHNSLFKVELSGRMENYDVVVTIYDYRGTLFGSSFFAEDWESSCIGGVEQFLFQGSGTDSAILEANILLGNVVEMQVPSDELEIAKADFEVFLEQAADAWAQIDLDVVEKKDFSPNSYFKHESITMEEAREEAEFCNFFPREIPEGFQEKLITMNYGPNFQTLSFVWRFEDQDLLWQTSHYSESDEKHLTQISQKENYDLSLYLEPNGQPVPEELQDIILDPIFDAEELTLDAVYARAHDADGVLTIERFSVRYGDILVTVSSKGVSPEWVYEQLKSLIP